LKALFSFYRFLFISEIVLVFHFCLYAKSPSFFRGATIRSIMPLINDPPVFRCILFIAFFHYYQCTTPLVSLQEKYLGFKIF